jgi:hypothetical protein
MLYSIYISMLDILLPDRGKKGPEKGNLGICEFDTQKGPAFTGPFPFSAYVDPGQYGIERVFQGYFVVRGPVFMADDGLPLDQRFDAASELPGGHVQKAQQPAVGHFLFRRFLQQAQVFPSTLFFRNQVWRRFGRWLSSDRRTGRYRWQKFLALSEDFFAHPRFSHTHVYRGAC